MPRNIFIESRGVTASFPDDATDDEIKNAIAKEFPRNGQDVEYEISTGDPQARNSLTVDDLRLYKAYKESQPSKGVGGWASSILQGIGSLGTTVAEGIGATFQEPGKALPSAAEGAARGTYDLVNLLTESTNPNSVLFQVKNLATNSGTEFEQLQQWKQALEIQARRERIARGEETLLVPSELVNPKQAEAASLFLDPTVLIPGGAAGKGAVLAERAVAAGLKGTGKVARGLARAAEAAGEAIGSRVEKMTGMAPEAAASVARNVGLGGAAYAFDPLSAAGTWLGTKSLAPIGEFLQATGEAMGKGPSRITPLMAVAADESISPLARSMAKAANALGGGLVLDVAPRTIQGLIEGGAIGSVLGALSEGEEGAAQGLGAGMAGGALGATVGRGFQYALDPLNAFKGMPFQGSIRNERVTADFERTLRKMSPEQAERAAAFAANMANKNFDARPLIADLNDAVGNLGRRIEYIRDGEMPVDVDGKPLFEDTKFQGVSVSRDAESGLDPVIYINVDRAGKSTVPHEIIHALRDTIIGERFVDNARKFLFGVDGAEISPDLAGQMVKEAGVPKQTILDFAEKYAGTGKNAEKFKASAERAYDPNVPLEERIRSQKYLADEMLAYYAGFNAVGGLRGQYKDVFLKGKLPNIVNSMFDLARDLTVNKLQRDGAFDFSKGLEQGFFKDGKQVKVKPMGEVVKEAFTALRDGTLDSAEPTTILSAKELGKEGMERINATFGTRIFDPNTGKIGEDLKPSGKPTMAPTGVPDPSGITDTRPLQGKPTGNPTKPQAEFVKDVLTTPSKPEELASGIGGFHTEKDGTVVFPMGMNEAQSEKFAASLNSRQRRLFYQLQKDFNRGINSIYFVTYAAETKKPKGIERGPGSASVKDQFIAVSNAEVIPYEMLMNKNGQFRTRFLDLGLVSRRMNELLQTKFKGAFASGLDAKEAFIQKYLPNLAKGTEPSAAMLADDNGKWGDARRNLFYEAMKPPMPDAFINPPSEDYSIKRSDRSVFRDYSLRNILSMAPSGGSTAFNANAYYKLKQNFMPAKVGDKDVFTNGVGTRVIEGTRGYRLYKPDGSLEGVYGDLETAMQKGHKVSASFQPDVDKSYLDAVKSGDIETAQQMVDEAANVEGFKTKAHHKTWESFTEFIQGGNLQKTRQWTGRHGNTRTLVGKSGKGFFFSLDRENTPAYHNQKKTGEKILDVYLNYKNPLVIDVTTKKWAIETFGDGNPEFPKILTNEAYDLVKQEYDSIEIYNKGYSNESKPDEVIVLDPNQIKSADPVTRDDKGNIIPPSKRFDLSSRDIRYQPSYDPESKVEPSGVPSIPSGDTTEASRLAYFNSPEGIQARRERFAAISAKLASDFETVLSRPVESLNPERIAAGLDELDAQINAAAQAALERLGISSVADQIAQERQAQTEQRSTESFATRKQQQAQSAAAQTPPPLTTHQAFRNVIAARRKPVIQVNLSRTFFPAAKATERELQRK